MEYKHLMYVPFTGLGKYNGFRGNEWLENRIKIFKQFVIPSLQNQTSHNFTLWVSWRREEKHNPLVKELMSYLETIKEFKSVHTFSGVCFYDDKYPYEVARERLIDSVHSSMGILLDYIADCKYVLMTIQPSDDCYHKSTIENIQKIFKDNPTYEGVGFSKGYIANYTTKEVAEYNPLTNPPFYTLKFPREIFMDPLKHLNFTALKHDVGEYKKGTPLPSHEYVKDCLVYAQIDFRGFLVGTHGANISTNFNIPYKGKPINNEILKEFGLENASPIKIKIGLVKRISLKLPYKVQRKLRYWFNI